MCDIFFKTTYSNIFKTKRTKNAKVKTILQLEALECGAACLAMVLSYHRKFVSLEQMRIDCAISKNGSTAKNIIIAAQKHGLHAQGLKIEPWALRSNVNLPCILHWNFNHFVVLTGFKKNSAIIIDPANGPCVISKKKFSECFTGICIDIKPGKNFKPTGKPKSTTKFIKKLVKNSLSAFCFFAIISSFSIIINLTKPGLLQVLIDRILTHQNSEWLFGFCAISIALAAAELATIWLKSVHFLKIKGKLAAESSCKFVWKILNLPLIFFANRFTGEINLRKQFNQSIASQIVGCLAPLAADAATILICIFIMAKQNLSLTFIVLLTIALTILISNLISKKISNIEKIKLKNEGKLASITIAGLNNIETIKTNALENKFFQNWASAHAKLNSQHFKYVNISEKIGSLPKLMANFNFKILLVAGAFFVIKQKLTIGMIVSFNMFLKMITKPLNNFLQTNNTLQNMKTKIEHIEDVKNYGKHNKTTQKNVSTKPLNGKIEIKNLNFSYFKNDPKPIIKNFSLIVEPGEKIAIIGPSGCGKTTIAKLLCGLYIPTSGEILFNGLQINKIDETLFKNSVFLAQSQPLFFKDTIKNNLKMFNDKISDIEMIEATKKAQIFDDIMQKGGFDCEIMHKGNNFSDGQKQQLEIARAFLQQPKILIFDEATSSLDWKTESEILKKIFNQNCSFIFLTHAIKNKNNFFKKIQLI